MTCSSLSSGSDTINDDVSKVSNSVEWDEAKAARKRPSIKDRISMLESKSNIMSCKSGSPVSAAAAASASKIRAENQSSTVS